jgi:7-carboxy-7-deazaguanine synthase
VLIETNGSINIAGLDSRAIVILDMKTPGSGMSDKMDFTNLEDIKGADEVKFVICSSGDYEWSKKLIETYNLQNRCGILLSPAAGLIKARELASWMIRDRLKARLNLQLHRYIFDPGERGV